MEGCQKIRIEDFLRVYRVKLKELVLASELEVLGIRIELITSKTCYDGIRFWFKCPFCDRRVGVLFKHPTSNKVGCRQCLNLEYKKRQYKGMIETAII